MRSAGGNSVQWSSTSVLARYLEKMLSLPWLNQQALAWRRGELRHEPICQKPSWFYACRTDGRGHYHRHSRRNRHTARLRLYPNQQYGGGRPGHFPYCGGDERLCPVAIENRCGLESRNRRDSSHARWFGDE